MRRAALYARVSTNLQEREQTIQSQLAAVTRHADRQGLRHTPALTYIDDGYSGTWLDRPALDELRDHAREGRFDVVVVLCPDRLARRYAYQVLLLEELKRVGIEILFCERPIDDTPDDQLLLQIQGAIAEYERAKVLERCRRGRLHRARRGELAPPSTPYGYRYAARKYGGDGKIRIDEEEAAMVRQVFTWYAEEGASLYRVWAYYNRRTRRPKSGVGPRAEGSPVRSVITERPRSEWIEVPVPRIIDDSLFRRVQERTEENRRFGKRRLRRHRVYLLRGLIKCGVCGHAFSGITNSARPQYRYYTCNHRYGLLRGGASPTCPNKMLRGDGVDEVVWTTVRDLLVDDRALAEELKGWLEKTTDETTVKQRLRLTTNRRPRPWISKISGRARRRWRNAFWGSSTSWRSCGPRPRDVSLRGGRSPASRRSRSSSGATSTTPASTPSRPSCGWSWTRSSSPGAGSRSTWLSRCQEVFV
jgi:site-specific DNA recombinase